MNAINTSSRTAIKFTRGQALAIARYGEAACLEAARLVDVEGNGDGYIASGYDITRTQAGCIIEAGRRLRDAE